MMSGREKMRRGMCIGLALVGLLGAGGLSSGAQAENAEAPAQVNEAETGMDLAEAPVQVNGAEAETDMNTDTDRWEELLEEYIEDEETNQLVFVRYTGGTDAEVQMYQKTGGSWEQILDCGGYVGYNGLGKERQGDRKTPTGTFELTQAFGIEDDPGARMPYVKVDSNLYWCADPVRYNQLTDIREYPHDCEGEHLIDFAPNYNYGMFLDFNKDCVVGAGAAIFLHCMGSRTYTEGCIAVSQDDMITIIQNAEEGAKICIYPA